MHFSILDAEAYLGLPGVGAILTVVIAAAIITAVLASVAFFKANRHGDEARSGIPWFKAAGALGSLWLITAIVSPVTEYFLRQRRHTAGGDSSAFEFGMEQFPIFTNFFMYTTFATFQVAQIEFTIGLNYASILSRERDVSGFFDEASPVPHFIGLVVYVCILAINAADVVCSELYYSGINAAFWPMKMTALSLDAALWLFSIGCLISTACQHYAAPQKRLWRILMGMNSVTAFHHGGLTILAGFYGVTIAQENLTYLATFISYAQLIFSSWMLVICLSIGYGVSVMAYKNGGLWTKDISSHKSLEEAKLHYPD
ncbi:unnamed protein product [Clonostachys rosea]|uniref:TLC domain-containing protein n=1 Tax=Bionectria ochroleuca TaxID=29856 RepID=A0ABY6UAR4_BIOOC|nr:unnamed protein product [Clonostachys rosea]